MKAEGQAPVTIGVGRFSVRHNIVVVDCSDEGILGVDVFTRGGARINLAARTVSLEGVEIPMKLVDAGICHRLRLTRGVISYSLTYMIVFLSTSIPHFDC